MSHPYDEDTFYFRTRSNKSIEMKCTDVRKMAWCLNNESLAGSIAITEIRKPGMEEIISLSHKSCNVLYNERDDGTNSAK